MLSKNYYFSEADRKYLSTAIARTANIILEKAEKVEKTDLVLDRDFRAGLNGIRYQQKKSESVVQVKAPLKFVEGSTNWDQNAVVDEDDL